MSEIKRFNEDLSKNKELLEEVKKLGNDVAKIVAYANSKGYNFTVADVDANAKKGGELSGEELDKVAGGFVIGAIVA
ncbi:MAG: hypothetical protein VR69_00995 [Peptococcaceae bacterium BRH_c4b]|nr:MAG: hypothetical protein VR69_00995 [Peptococcaceae bacterium BRH_c4b]